MAYDWWAIPFFLIFACAGVFVIFVGTRPLNHTWRKVLIAISGCAGGILSVFVAWQFFTAGRAADVIPTVQMRYFLCFAILFVTTAVELCVAAVAVAIARRHAAPATDSINPD